MLDFFNSDFVILSVNIIVLIGFLLVIYFVLKKFLPSLAGENLKDKIKTSTTSQNVFAFISVVIASSFLDLFSNGKYHMLWSVATISILTIIFNVLYEKVANKNDEIDSKEEYKKGLTLLEQIIHCKGYGLIKNTMEIESIEDSSDEIYVFSENIITDIGKEFVDEEYYNKGLYANVVSQNIPKGKKYIYFLKDTHENREYYQLYYKYHFKDKNETFIGNISFYFVPESEFCFFSEIYLYKDLHNKDVAFEWIPSIGEEGNDHKQFYLQLSSNQVQNINEIMCDLMISCKKYTLEEVRNEL